MGFSDYAQSILKSNRELRKKYRRKFTSAKESYSYGPNNKPIEFNEASHKRSLKKKRIAIIKPLIVLLVIILLTLYGGNRYVKSAFPSYLQTQKQKKAKRIEGLHSSNSIMSYSSWIKSGNEYLEQKNYTQAYDNFMIAKQINERGKAANLGIAKCLLHDCKLEKLNCELSEKYYQMLIKYGNLNPEELEKMNAFK